MEKYWVHICFFIAYWRKTYVIQVCIAYWWFKFNCDIETDKTSVYTFVDPITNTCDWQSYISSSFLFFVSFIGFMIPLFKSNPNMQRKHSTLSNKTVNNHIIYWHKAQPDQSKMLVWAKCMCCPWAVLAECSGQYKLRFFLLLFSLSSGNFSPRRGCSRVLKICMRPSTNKNKSTPSKNSDKNSE